LAQVIFFLTSPTTADIVEPTLYENIVTQRLSLAASANRYYNYQLFFAMSYVSLINREETKQNETINRILNNRPQKF
jgi:hypothetical protein